MVKEGHIITYLFRQSLFIIFPVIFINESIEIYFGNTFEIITHYSAFTMYYILPCTTFSRYR